MPWAAFFCLHSSAAADLLRQRMRRRESFAGNSLPSAVSRLFRTAETGTLTGNRLCFRQGSGRPFSGRTAGSRGCCKRRTIHSPSNTSKPHSFWAWSWNLLPSRASVRITTTAPPRAGFASATALREWIQKGEGWEPFVPSEAAEIIKREIALGACPADPAGWSVLFCFACAP